MVRWIVGITCGGFPLKSSSRIEELDYEVVEQVHSVGGDGPINALLSIHSGGDGVVDAVQLIGGLGLHPRHGGERGEVGADKFSLIFIVFA